MVQAAILFSLFFINDMIKYSNDERSYIGAHIVLRAVAVAIMVAGSYAVRRCDIIRRGWFTVAVCILVLGVTQVTFGVIEENTLHSTISVGVVLIHATTGSFFRLGYLPAAIINVILTVLFAIVTYATQAYTGTGNFLFVLFFLVLSCFFYSHSAYDREYYVRLGYLGERVLEHEEAKTKRVLERMLPAVIISKLRAGAHFVWEEFECVTVLFSHVHDFDSFTVGSNGNARVVVTLLNALFLRFDVLTDVLGVYKVETIGDVYLVCAGVTAERKDHAQVMCILGLCMHETMASFVDEYNGNKVALRVGIHSGPVAAGVVGISYPRYRLMGDTVNTSSRMSTVCSAGDTQLSDGTASLLVKEDGFEIKARPGVQVKGKGLMDLWLLIDHVPTTAMLPANLAVQARSLGRARLYERGDDAALPTQPASLLNGGDLEGSSSSTSGADAAHSSIFTRMAHAAKVAKSLKKERASKDSRKRSNRRSMDASSRFRSRAEIAGDNQAAAVDSLVNADAEADKLFFRELRLCEMLKCNEIESTHADVNDFTPEQMRAEEKELDRLLARHPTNFRSRIDDKDGSNRSNRSGPGGSSTEGGSFSAVSLHASNIPSVPGSLNMDRMLSMSRTHATLRHQLTKTETAVDQALKVATSHMSADGRYRRRSDHKRSQSNGKLGQLLIVSIPKSSRIGKMNSVGVRGGHGSGMHALGTDIVPYVDPILSPRTQRNEEVNALQLHLSATNQAPHHPSLADAAFSPLASPLIKTPAQHMSVSMSMDNASVSEHGSNSSLRLETSLSVDVDSPANQSRENSSPRKRDQASPRSQFSAERALSGVSIGTPQHLSRQNSAKTLLTERVFETAFNADTRMFSIPTLDEIYPDGTSFFRSLKFDQYHDLEAHFSEWHFSKFVFPNRGAIKLLTVTMMVFGWLDTFLYLPKDAHESMLYTVCWPLRLLVIIAGIACLRASKRDAYQDHMQLATGGFMILFAAVFITVQAMLYSATTLYVYAVLLVLHSITNVFAGMQPLAARITSVFTIVYLICASLVAEKNFPFAGTGILCASVVMNTFSNFNSALYLRRDYIHSLKHGDEVEKSASFLKGMLPQQVVDEMRSGESCIHEIDHASVLFCDVVGFTALSSRITPDALITFLNTMFSTFDNLAEQYSVYKVETIGDAYLACSGVVGALPEENHTALLIDCALSMQYATHFFHVAGIDKATSVRIGIHTGAVIAGVIGRKMPRYHLFGETVTLAEEMESKGIPGRVVISAETQRETHGVFELEALPDITTPNGKVVGRFLVVRRSGIDAHLDPKMESVVAAVEQRAVQDMARVRSLSFGGNTGFTPDHLSFPTPLSHHHSLVSEQSLSPRNNQEGPSMLRSEKSNLYDEPVSEGSEVSPSMASPLLQSQPAKLNVITDAAVSNQAAYIYADGDMLPSALDSDVSQTQSMAAMVATPRHLSSTSHFSNPHCNIDSSADGSSTSEMPALATKENSLVDVEDLPLPYVAPVKQWQPDVADIDRMSSMDGTLHTPPESPLAAATDASLFSFDEKAKSKSPSSSKSSSSSSSSLLSSSSSSSISTSSTVVPSSTPFTANAPLSPPRVRDGAGGGGGGFGNHLRLTASERLQRRRAGPTTTTTTTTATSPVSVSEQAQAMMSAMVSAKGTTTIGAQLMQSPSKGIVVSNPPHVSWTRAAFKRGEVHTHNVNVTPSKMAPPPPLPAPVTFEKTASPRVRHEVAALLVEARARISVSISQLPPPARGVKQCIVAMYTRTHDDDVYTLAARTESLARASGSSHLAFSTPLPIEDTLRGGGRLKIVVFDVHDGEDADGSNNDDGGDDAAAAVAGNGKPIVTQEEHMVGSCVVAVDELLATATAAASLATLGARFGETTDPVARLFHALMRDGTTVGASRVGIVVTQRAGALPTRGHDERQYRQMSRPRARLFEAAGAITGDIVDSTTADTRVRAEPAARFSGAATRARGSIGGGVNAHDVFRAPARADDHSQLLSAIATTAATATPVKLAPPSRIAAPTSLNNGLSYGRHRSAVAKKDAEIRFLEASQTDWSTQAAHHFPPPQRKAVTVERDAAVTAVAAAVVATGGSDVRVGDASSSMHGESSMQQAQRSRVLAPFWS
jgi:class 3 adenylate cyclase